MMSGEENPREECGSRDSCVSRREFLLGGGAAAITIWLAGFPDTASTAENVPARVVGYPKRKVGKLSALRQDQPVPFKYPHDHPNCSAFVVRLGAEAAGGVGPGKDVVAFSYLCTHMGGGLFNTYKSEHKAIGPCPLHLTVFDLRRRGMVVSGHATQSLPQIMLETEGDDIYATGVLGLLYGFADNKVSRQAR